MDNFSFKELYDVVLKTTLDIEIAGRKFEKGETLASFDKIQLANFKEIKEHVVARGGYANLPKVFWDTTKGINLSFTQGVISKLQFGIMCNSKIVSILKDEGLPIHTQETLESDENGYITLSKRPLSYNFFLYDKDGTRVKDFSVKGESTLKTPSPFKEYIADYYFLYTNSAAVYHLGEELLKNELYFEAKTRVKDDETGKVVTGILTIPKLKLMSEVSFRLGKDAAPITGNFQAIGLPKGDRQDNTAMTFTLLSDDIDSDI